MTKKFVPSPVAIHALPYVNGESRRFKSEPTKLTPLAGKIMLASGALSTRRKVASFPLGRICGAIAFLALAAALLLDAGQRPSNVQAQIAHPAQIEAQLLTVGLFEPRDQMTSGQNENRTARDPAEAASALESQDRFEIARFIRLSAAARPVRKAVLAAQKKADPGRRGRLAIAPQAAPQS